MASDDAAAKLVLIIVIISFAFFIYNYIRCYR